MARSFAVRRFVLTVEVENRDGRRVCRIRESQCGAQSRRPRLHVSFGRSIIIMSGSLHPVEIHRRRQRTEKRNKLRARIAAAAGAALEAKLQKTYGPVPDRSRS